MEYIQEILRMFFGNDVAISEICSVISVVLVPVLTVIYNKMKNKLLMSDSEGKAKDAQIAELETKLENTEKCVSYLADMMTSTYLTSNTISDEQKKKLTYYAGKIDKLAGVELSKSTEKIIDAVSTYVPDLNSKKEEIIKATDEAEKIVDTINDATQAAIDKLKV